MFLEYATYLAVILVSTLALKRAFGIQLPFRRMAFTLLPVAAAFIAWDVWAVAAGHWSFDSRFVTGFFAGNQPVEEIAFFFVVPLFYVVVWEISKGKASGAPKRMQGGARP